MKIGFLNISDTRNEIRHMIKRLERDKQYEIIEVSNIKSNQKIQSTVMCVLSISGSVINRNSKRKNTEGQNYV